MIDESDDDESAARKIVERSQPDVHGPICPRTSVSSPRTGVSADRCVQSPDRCLHGPVCPVHGPVSPRTDVSTDRCVHVPIFVRVRFGLG